MQFLFHRSIYASPLLRSAEFRDAVLATLAIRTRLGTVRRDGPGLVGYEVDGGVRGGFSVPEADLEGVAVGVDRGFRNCDYLAWQVASIDGAPRCELYWPEDRRDVAVAECAGFLGTYGDRLASTPPGHKVDFPRPGQATAYLAFPILDRPATREDVRAGRAIFSLGGKGEAHRMRLAGLPIRVRRIPAEDARRPEAQDGWIWQAEELRNGDRRESYFGFVGRHVIERVPASEIELASDGFQWGPLADGLDARVEPAEPSRHAYEPGQPVPLIVRIRNRRPIENSAPTEYVRRGPDGRPSLRRGIRLAVSYTAPGRPDARFPQRGPAEELKPSRTDRFDPGPAARPLGPFEVLDAMPINLGEWFDLTRAGSYRIHVGFAAEAGLGGGTSNELYLAIGETNGPVP